MGEWFTSFDDAWSNFLAREEPLESFFEQFPEEDHVVDGWLIVPPPEVKREVLRLQAELEDVPGLELVPHHFLHVWLRGADGPRVEDVVEEAPVEIAYEKVNCFHTAVVVEAHSDALERVEAPDTFLPHLTIAAVRGAAAVASVREPVVPLRDAALGRAGVDQILRVRVPASRSTILQPWTVVERLPLRG